MMRSIAGTLPLVYARATGFLYIIIIVFGIFSEVAVRSSLMIPGDPTATAANVASSELLFRISFAADTVVFLCDVAVAVLFYILLSPVSKTLSLVAAAMRLTQTAVIAYNLLNQYTILLILNGEYMKAFPADQQNALMLLAFEVQGHGYDLGLLFFGVSCLVLGYLIANSGYLPKPLGYLVMAAGAVYLIGSYTLFIFPNYAAAVQPLYLVPLVSELSLGLWLLIRGVNVEQWERANRDPAAPKA